MKYIYEEESLPSVKANAEIAQFAQGCLNTNSYFLLTRIDYIKPRSHPSLRSLLYSVCSVCSQGASKALCRAVQGPPCEKGERNLNRRMPRSRLGRKRTACLANWNPPLLSAIRALLPSSNTPSQVATQSAHCGAVP